LSFHEGQHPIVVQLGGNNPDQMREAAIICEQLKYDEINLNVGCPSPRVQEGSFGACLMKNPDLVSEILKSIRQAVNIPCSVKCRIGVDDMDSFDFLKKFVHRVSENG